MFRSLSVCLINPRSKPSYWTADYAIPIIGLGRRLKYSMANGALVSIAALVPPEHEVVIVDENVEDIDFGKLCRFDVIGVTGMIVQSERMFEILRELRMLDVVVAVGGPLVSVNQSAFEGLCDARFIGEAEQTWPEFLNAVAAGEPRPDRYEQAEKTVMTTVPTPRFDLLKRGAYGNAPVQFSRGCPFQCEFCDIITIFGRTPRVKSPKQIIAEFNAVYRQGFTGCFLVDDNFIGNKREAKKLLPHIIDWQRRNGRPLALITEASVNLADDQELIDLMVRANFKNVFVGIETPRRESLIETRKLQNVAGDSLLDKIKRIRDRGLDVSAGFIVGFDSDDERIFDEQYEFIQASGISTLSISLLTPLPTTPLYERLKKEDRLDFSDPDLIFIPKQMSRTQLKDGFKDLLRRVWAADAFFERVFTGRRETEGLGSRSLRSAVVIVGLSIISAVRAGYLALLILKEGELRSHLEALRRVLRKNWKLGPHRLRFHEIVGSWITYWHFARVTRDISGTDFGTIHEFKDTPRVPAPVPTGGSNA